ncbi:CBO0543 family protein [Heyndrickxia vini]|uniref:DUF2878 domain-containing protein n=1 Tax=Heyndrickxia vini TaxID=1476025 RepID=A0ABX7E7M1_9BACI|nr:CBO0543 family protein [Heyndrickxia vini]QQZ11260.1 hypothetical protein I5776_10390 [Heyndrickxia vini]
MDFNEGIRQSEKGTQQIIKGDATISDAVVHDFLFTWQWWFGIALFIIPWIVWFIFRKKESTGRLLAAGFSAIILSLIIDLITDSLGVWTYPMKFSPIAPKLILPYHFSLTPVVLMFFLQIKPHVSPLLKAVIFSFLGAFIVMKFFVYIKFYDPKEWPSIFDFGIFLIIYGIGYFICNKLKFDTVSIQSNKK